jgi:tRNA-dihydrouridine synthase C
VTPRVVLAPMEGLVDPPMRDVLTRLGGIDWCVSEFIRVTAGPLHRPTLLNIIPEALNDWRTRAGVPIRPQLLGSDPRWLAHNAQLLVDMGAEVIDLNFGCPAKTVNRHGGGAGLLREPELLTRIVSSVRDAVPERIPVTAKMRLGYSDTSLTLECARALVDAGAAELVVHARTKVEGYKPPAHWEWLARIREAVEVPVIANGEVWTLEDYLGIRAASGCDTVMIGRGLVSRPDLAWQIKAHLAGSDAEPMAWQAMQPWLLDFYQQTRERVVARHVPGRLKQWLAMLIRGFPEAQVLFDRVRRENDPDAVAAALAEVSRSSQAA